MWQRCRSKDTVIRFLWAKASAYAIIHPELCPVHSDKCFTKPAIHACSGGGSNLEVLRHGERGARAYNGGLGAEPPAGSRGRAPGQGVRGAKPPEAENLLGFGRQMEAANLPLFSVIFD